MKKFILLLLFLPGCTTTPQPCGMKVNNECREPSASERSGAVVRGHSVETKDITP